LLGNKQLAAVGLAGANANWLLEGDPGQGIARVIVEQLRIIRVTESGIGLANQFRLPRHLAKEADHGEPADASQRRKPNVLLSREKHETKRYGVQVVEWIGLIPFSFQFFTRLATVFSEKAI
jgi:hypothetical protein